jgi:uncharacterized protein (TIGR00369 family)
LDKEAHYRKLERMYAAAPINEFFAPRLTISDGRSEVVITIHNGLFHAANAVHGSVYFKAMDDAAFFAANSLVDDVFVLTSHFTIYFLKPISTGEMIATGRVVHATRRQYVAEAKLVDAEGHAIGRGSGTFTRSNIRLSSDLGYV